MNTEGASKKRNHPKRSQPDQKARENFANGKKTAHNASMAEYNSVTNIVTHHTLAKPQRSKTPLPNHPSFHNKFLIYIFFQIDDSRPLFSPGDSIARFDRPN